MPVAGPSKVSAGLRSPPVEERQAARARRSPRRSRQRSNRLPGSTTPRRDLRCARPQSCHGRHRGKQTTIMSPHCCPTCLGLGLPHLSRPGAACAQGRGTPPWHKLGITAHGQGEQGRRRREARRDQTCSRPRPRPGSGTAARSSARRACTSAESSKTGWRGRQHLLAGPGRQRAPARSAPQGPPSSAASALPCRGAPACAGILPAAWSGQVRWRLEPCGLIELCGFPASRWHGHAHSTKGTTRPSGGREGQPL